MTRVKECLRCDLPHRADHRCPARSEPLPGIYRSQCQNCSFALDNRGLETIDLVYGYRAYMTRAAYEHVRDTGHRVHVTMTLSHILVPHPDGSAP